MMCLPLHVPRTPGECLESNQGAPSNYVFVHSNFSAPCHIASLPHSSPLAPKGPGLAGDEKSDDEAKQAEDRAEKLDDEDSDEPRQKNGQLLESIQSSRGAPVAERQQALTASGRPRQPGRRRCR